MPLIRVETIGPIDSTSAAASALTPDSAMMKPTTVPISPRITRLFARWRIEEMRAASLSFNAEAASPRAWPSRP
jgi:hypothetical protein